MKWVIAVLLTVWLLGGGVSAQTVEELYEEQLAASGSRELIDTLPESTQDLLYRLGVDNLDSPSLTAPDLDQWQEALSAMLSSALQTPLRVAGTVLAAVLLYAWANGLRSALHEEETVTVFGTVCALALSGCLLVPLTQCIRKVSEAMTSVAVFMGSFTPVYAGILLTDGRASAALSFQSLVLYAAQVLSWVAGTVIVPLMTAGLALGVTGSVTPRIQLGSTGKLLNKAAVWMLSLGMMLFTGLLSLQTLVGGAADTVGARAAKFSVASLVPVVGGSLSEMLATVRGCLQLLRSTVGGFGLLATVLIVLPPLCSCCGWSVLLAVCRAAADMLELPALPAVLEAARSTVRSLIGVLCACASFLIVAVTVVTKAAGG